MKRTILEVLADFTSLVVPLQYIFDFFPVIKARPYSIASSPRVHPGQVHLCVAVVNYRTRMSTPRLGICTTYMQTWESGDVVKIKLQRGVLKVPEDLSVPIVCIGPGTGVAPMRSVLLTRAAQIEHVGASSLPARDQGIPNTGDQQLNSNYTTQTVDSSGPKYPLALFFGCRYSLMDHLYSDTWPSIIKYNAAFSRDQPDKIYVQDLILQNSDWLYDWVFKRQGLVLVSGSSHGMPGQIRLALKDVLCRHEESSVEESGRRVKQMELVGRLQFDTWS